MPISATSVLWGIAAPRLKIRYPQSLEDFEILDLAAPGIPVEMRPSLVSLGPQRIARDLRLRHTDVGYRFLFTFSYPYIEPADVIKWIKIVNAHLAGFDLILIPHNDAALKLQFQVIPVGDFELSYFANKFLAHTLTLRFQQIDYVTALDLRTAANEFNRVIYPV